jgi:hypothetical protein
VHPSTDSALTARLCEATSQVVVRFEPPSRPLGRNRAIVRTVDLLVAAPSSAIEEIRSGTWSTVRFARSQGRRVLILAPEQLKISRPGFDDISRGIRLVFHPGASADASRRSEDNNSHENILIEVPRRSTGIAVAPGVQDADQVLPSLMDAVLTSRQKARITLSR